MKGDKKKEWDSIKDRVCFSISNGRRVKFWKDRWSGDSSVKESFPSLFSFATNKDAWAVDVWEQNGESG